jgi:hypothetical protein
MLAREEVLIFEGLVSRFDSLSEARVKCGGSDGTRTRDLLREWCGIGCPQVMRASSRKSFLFNLSFENKRVRKIFGSGTMYGNVAPHAWSPPNFPHSDKEAKANYVSRNGTLRWRTFHEDHGMPAVTPESMIQLRDTMRAEGPSPDVESECCSSVARR